MLPDAGRIPDATRCLAPSVAEAQGAARRGWTIRAHTTSDSNGASGRDGRKGGEAARSARSGRASAASICMSPTTAARAVEPRAEKSRQQTQDRGDPRFLRS